MSYIINDRRKSDKNKSSNNRKRFLDRVNDQIKDSVKNIINDSNIDDILSSKRKKVTIPGKGLDKPNFNYSNTGGIRDYILTGNDRYITGDTMDKPPSGGGSGGKQASNGEDGEDDFSFTLSREEFMNIFFDGLELPDLVKKELAKITESVPKRAGFSSDGTPNRLNILRSMKQSKGRRFALKTPKKKKLEQLESQLVILLLVEEQHRTDEQNQTIIKLEQEIEVLKRKIKAVPFLDDVDLRYNRWENVQIPSTQAVVFAIMDVSGSMGDWEKEIGKSFFILLRLFLTYNYDKIDIVWISHTTEAREVTEDQFFHDKINGGTVVSSALKLMKSIINERYSPSQWNIFGCQISDGDNYSDDLRTCVEFLQQEILPIVQYYIYIEVRGSGSGDLWPYYASLQKTVKNMISESIYNKVNIYPIFRKIFAKRK